jgi:hypothetical protein
MGQVRPAWTSAGRDLSKWSAIGATAYGPTRRNAKRIAEGSGFAAADNKLFVTESNGPQIAIAVPMGT